LRQLLPAGITANNTGAADLYTGIEAACDSAYTNSGMPQQGEVSDCGTLMFIAVVCTLLLLAVPVMLRLLRRCGSYQTPADLAMLLFAAAAAAAMAVVSEPCSLFVAAAAA
jgi:hypothetical protein